MSIYGDSGYIMQICGRGDLVVRFLYFSCKSCSDLT